MVGASPYEQSTASEVMPTQADTAHVSTNGLVRQLIILLAIAGCVFIAGATFRAQEIAVPVDVQYTVLLKVLTFDRHFTARAKNDLVIGIVYQRNFRISLLVKDEFVAVSGSSSRGIIGDTRVRCVPIDIDAGRLAEIVSTQHVDILYIAPLRSVSVDDIVAVSRTNHLPTITGVPEYVESGLAVGVGTKGEKPQIIINLTAARAEGCDFNAQLLNLAKVIQ